MNDLTVGQGDSLTMIEHALRSGGVAGGELEGHHLEDAFRLDGNEHRLVGHERRAADRPETVAKRGMKISQRRDIGGAVRELTDALGGADFCKILGGYAVAVEEEDIREVVGQLPTLDAAAALGVHDNEHCRPDHEGGRGAGCAPHAAGKLLAKQRRLHAHENSGWPGEQFFRDPDEQRGDQEKAQH